MWRDRLFAKNGLAGTTMNDIAVASGKGRRTLYTYFNRKEDVYYAVIESELERLSDKARRGCGEEDSSAGQDCGAYLYSPEHDQGNCGAQR